jgi:hypothetical protein
MTNEGSRSGKSGLTKPLLAILVICIVSALVLSISPPNGTGIITPTIQAIVTPSKTPSPSPTVSKPPIVTVAPLVLDIKVQQWNIETECKSPYATMIRIVGIIIYGGLPPFYVQMEYEDGTVLDRKQIAPASLIISPNLYKASIIPSIDVIPDKWILVTIKSNASDGQPSWTGKLFFPSESPDCH